MRHLLDWLLGKELSLLHRIQGQSLIFKLVTFQSVRVYMR